MDKSPLDKICSDLNAFNQRLLDMKNNNAETYDSSLTLPLWRKDNIQDFANEFSATSARFLGRKNLLNNPHAVVHSESENKKVLASTGKTLLAHVKTYQDNIIRDELSTKLADGLKNLDTILKNYQRPENKPGNPLPRPGKF
jgi:hypothetical protein